MRQKYFKGGLWHPVFMTPKGSGNWRGDGAMHGDGPDSYIITPKILIQQAWASTAQGHRDRITARIAFLRAPGRSQWDKLLAWRLETILAGYTVGRAARFFSLNSRELRYLDQETGETYRPKNVRFFLPLSDRTAAPPQRDWASTLIRHHRHGYFGNGKRKQLAKSTT